MPPSTDLVAALRAPGRLRALDELAALDRPADPALDRLTALAAQILDVPVALVTLVDHERQFFTSAYGLHEPWASRRETPLSHSFCQHVVVTRAALVVPDAARHPLVCDNAAIEDLGVRAYLGQPVTAPDGTVVGSFALVDTQPRAWTAREVHLVAEFAALATRELAIGRAARTAALLLERSPDAFVVLDAAWRVHSANPAASAVLGMPAATAVGQPVWGVLPPAVARALEPLARRAAAARQPVEAEVCLGAEGAGAEADEGGPGWLAVQALPSRDGVALLVRDTTARRHAEAERERLLAVAEAGRREVEAANRAKSEFLAVMSHELRTPLNAIGGYAELLELGIRGPVTPQQREDLGRIQRSQRHLLSLINQVLNYARLESGAVAYHLEDVPVAAAVAAAEALVAPQLRARGLDFVRGGSDRSLLVRADAEKLQQVLLNLLSNAVKFTNARPGLPGRVEVTCAALPPAGDDDARVAIAVRDTGVGIAPEKLRLVFEPFVQVDARLTRTQEGVGLGLAISRDLARGMGGDLVAESTPGVGSTFTLVLPRGSRSASAAG